MEQISVEILLVGFILIQSISAWVNTRNQRSKEELNLLRSTNEHVRILTEKVAMLKRAVDDREAELAVLRPMAKQVPILETQVQALKVEFQNCLEWKQKAQEIIDGRN